MPCMYILDEYLSSIIQFLQVKRQEAIYIMACVSFLFFFGMLHGLEKNIFYAIDNRDETKLLFSILSTTDRSERNNNQPVNPDKPVCSSMKNIICGENIFYLCLFDLNLTDCLWFMSACLLSNSDIARALSSISVHF